MTRQIMGLQGDLSLPHHSDLDALANQFNDYFINKINEIRDKFDMSIKFENIMRADNIFDGHILERFVPTSEDEVRELILRAPCKSCSLDPLLTWLLKQSVDVLVPIITAILILSNVQMLHAFKLILIKYTQRSL
ncbi:hypothetical protein HOLleu_20750 [Holothuria leucospilota]|uniref:Uncharacterized protein n=1 Tax=Holothuria leucospilota TaxID=206669 RepID=A0A9Q1C202_HOLLE|nr:hypothetical protein HOLleu_20750 [Holothuria leucospilota]